MAKSPRFCLQQNISNKITQLLSQRLSVVAQRRRDWTVIWRLGYGQLTNLMTTSLLSFFVHFELHFTLFFNF